MTVCKFFAQGFCRNGDSCHFTHETSGSSGPHLAPVAPVLPTTELMNRKPTAVTDGNGESKQAQICRFFSQGKCSKGKECRYIHLPAILPLQQAYPSAISIGSPQLSTDSRATVSCRFLSSSGGCQNPSCPYLHVADEPGAEKGVREGLVTNEEEEDQESEDDFIRNLLGATVYFNDVGHILKVSFPNDFSLACITGLVPGITPEIIVNILCGLGFNISADCVRIPKSMVISEPTATVKVEDPLFARELSSRLKKQGSALSAAPIPIHAQQTNFRKVYISWHKSNRNVWLNFGSGEIANRVAQKFNENRYKCLGQSVISSRGKCSPSRAGRRANPLAWTMVLSDVPNDASSRDIKEAIKSLNDRPRHVELGPSSYQASDAEVSVVVRSCLEKYGTLESFYLTPTNKGKRVKATALFTDEADARSACSLNNRPVGILGKGKLTVTLIQSAKIKVPTAVYIATKSEIEKSKTWNDRQLKLHVYPDAVQRFTTMKVEGSGAHDVASARRTLDQILSGIILTAGGNPIWNPSLSSNGSLYKKLKSIETELHILIIRNKTKRQLQYYGPPEKFQVVVHQVTDMLREECFKNNGIEQQQDTASIITKGNHALDGRPVLGVASTAEVKCPICFDDQPDTPIQTLCKHTYCLECFENYCLSAASASKDKFRIECQGDDGNCVEKFNLTELKDHLSSSAFELVLKSSFTEYVQRHPKEFHYCPTADCGYVYRCTASNSKPLAYTCSNCLELICTSCHARHGDYTCAEYKDIESGGYEALEKLKLKLNFKDCPKCKTTMEKTEGCNHMTCGGCRAHICWVCMAVFATSDPCYTHMRKEHGGIGLEQH